jgi:hypothetical protein
MSFFSSLTRSFVSLFFLLVGIICIMIPWSSTIRTELIQFILEDSLIIFLFGFSFLLIALAFIANLIFSARKKYYSVEGGNNSVEVDEELIKQYLQTYWKDLFPKYQVPCRLILKKNKLQIYADLPYLPETEQKNLIERIKKDLTDIFVRILGYKCEFLLSVSFQSEKKLPST